MGKSWDDALARGGFQETPHSPRGDRRHLPEFGLPENLVWEKWWAIVKSPLNASVLNLRFVDKSYMGGMKGRDLAEGTPSLETRNPAALKPSVNLPRSICSSLKWEWGCWLAGCSGQRWCLLPPALPSCSLWASHGAGTISSNGFLTTTLEGSCNTRSTVRDIWIDYVERVQSKSNERKIDPASIGFIMVCHKVHQRRWKFFHYFGTPSFILLLNHTVVR